MSGARATQADVAAAMAAFAPAKPVVAASKPRRKQARWVGVVDTSPVEIYALLCPETGEIRYIGKSRNSATRLRQHLSAAKSMTTPVNRWVHSLMQRGLAPVLKIAMTVPFEGWEAEERALISVCQRHNIPLLNLAEGGEQPSMSREQRAANGRKVLEMIHSDPRRRQIWLIKQQKGKALKFLKDNGDTEGYEKLCEFLRGVAARNPADFGAWAKL